MLDYGSKLLMLDYGSNHECNDIDVLPEIQSSTVNKSSVCRPIGPSAPNRYN